VAWTLEANIKGPAGVPGGAPAWQGTWQPATAYSANDAVSYQGSSYYAPSAIAPDVAPPAAPWQTIAQQGAPGPPGVSNAAHTGEWNWSNQTTSPPANGQVRANNSAPLSVTRLFVSAQNAGGTDTSNFQGAITVGDDLYLQQKTDASNWSRWDITGTPIDHTTWWEYPVTPVAGSPTAITNNTPIDVSFLTVTGGAAQWYTGAGAPAATLGGPGDMYLAADGSVWRNDEVAGWQVSPTDLTGPQGSQGPQGMQGPPGPQGVPGTPATLGPTLTTIEALTGSANTGICFTGTDVAALFPLTAFARTLLDDGDAATMRGTLGVPATAAVQPLDATLTALAGLATGADQLPYATGTETFAQTTLTPLARTLLDDSTQGAMQMTLGLGTLATQNANAVALTGGTATLASAQVGAVGIGVAPTGHPLWIRYTPPGVYGLVVQQSVDTAGSAALIFLNAASGAVGSIVTTATTTAYNTSSDVRLKHAVATLTGALERVRALRPVSFQWQADDSPGVGFLAHQLMTVIPEAVSGEPDAVHADGSVRPQGVDLSKLVPWLTAALQESLAQVQALTVQVQALTARVVALEA
jgi:Chaperone of endosialidase